MKRPVLILILVGFLCGLNVTEAGAQLWKMRRFELMGGLGPSFFFGDIGGFSPKENVLGFKDLSFLQTRYNFNASAKYRVAEDLNVRLSLTGARLKATDERGSNEGRMMESSIFIIEPALIGEFYFIRTRMKTVIYFQKVRPVFKDLSILLTFMRFRVSGEQTTV
jgi:hypothetical protein